MTSSNWLVICISYIAFIISYKAPAQTFTSNTLVNSIPRQAIAEINNPITVSGLPSSLDGLNIGLVEVSLTLNTGEYDRIEFFLVSPDGTMLQLIDGRKDGSTGGAGTEDVSGTFKFKMDADLPEIRFWVSTPTPLEAYRPDVSLNSANNGQNPNGTWKLYGRSANLFSRGTTISSWSITFGSNNVTPAVSNDACGGAIKLRNFKTTGKFIEGNNFNTAAHISEGGALGSRNNCYSASKRYPVTTAWYYFTPYCSTDVVKIHAYGSPYASLVRGSCNGTYTVEKCTSGSGDLTFTGFNAPGQTYHLILEGQNSFTDRYDIYWTPGVCPRSPVGMINYAGIYQETTRSIQINWKTAWEQNNESFQIIYKKSDWIEYITAGSVKATNSTSGSPYQFQIPISEEGTYHIQIIQKDFDGTIEMFGPMLVQTDHDLQNPLKVINTESGKEVWAFIDEDSPIFFTFCSTSGSILFEKYIDGAKGWNKIKIPDTASGIYLLHAVTNQYYETAKILQE